MSRATLALTFALVAGVAGLLGLLAGGGGVVNAVPSPAAPAPTSAGRPDFADIVQRVNPAVVNITVLEGGESRSRSGRGTERDDARRGEGSGFIVDAQGFILTNHHVVESPNRIRVSLADKREFTATLVGSDPATDLALLKIPAAGLPTVPLGDSDRLRVGEWVCAIGNPYRFDHSVTVGVVSSKGRKIYDPSFDAYIQTDAAINPGNSGGPLVNVAGEVVGINSAVSLQGQGIGFAVPINVARDVLSQLRDHGRVTRGYLGIQLQDLDPDLQRLVSAPEGRGALVVDVLDKKAGQAAGLKRYDVITAVAGTPVDDGDQLVCAISNRAPGSSVLLTVRRDGHEMTVLARLDARAGDEQPAERIELDEESEEGPAGDALGLVVADLGRQAQADLRIPADRRGVVVRDVVGLDPGADALSHGDVVVEVNRQPTPDVASYQRAIDALAPGESAWLYVYRPRPRGTFLVKVEAGNPR
jgi:serine protease Do